MSDPVTYPPDLPFCPVDGTRSGQIDDNDLVFTPDAGPDIVRSRYSSSFKAIGFDLVMTRAEFDRLEQFFLNDCGKRVYPFDAPHVYKPGLRAVYYWASPPADRPFVPNGAKVRVSVSLKMEV